MAETRPLRRLAAILVADIVGYSRRMEADEAGTLVALKQWREEILGPLVGEHAGRIVKVMGDGVLIEFTSAVNAVACAQAIQAQTAEANATAAEENRNLLRVGINLGDIVEEGSDIYGDGVNIASRLEALAPPAGICIAASVHDAVFGKIAMAAEDLGECQLKNIARPVRAYVLRYGAPAEPRSPQPLPLPDKPSIAVLAFDNLSGDPEQEYFADGIVEEIITALSRIKWLFVIARNSSFVYKGRMVDVKQVGRELGVRYVLQGSVRKSGSRVRITGQLIDAATGIQIWADRFEGALEDIFDLQDQVTMRVVGAIFPKLEEAEIARVKSKPTESLDAYQCYMRGMAAFYQMSEESNQSAFTHFYRAIELDSNFASAYGMAARSYAQRKAFGWRSIDAWEMAETERLARRAAALGKDDATALTAAGVALAYVIGDLDSGDAMITRALSLNPNFASAWLFSGWVKVWLGEPVAAIDHVSRAMRLSPQDPNMFNMQAATAAAHFLAGRHEEALVMAVAAVENQPNYALANSILAASAAHCERPAIARAAVARLRVQEPGLRISRITDLFPVRSSGDLAKLAEGLSKAGLPG
ncbi:adenylate/guanylate cyclase domain-containing protein [Nordella sp. HKS 07]|uniref:adenylate/guanylate cyclase domain-containing protein n=1 Tax=Nordella sp. HKS 07 TaxID=2712222 RepID=UPI001FEDA04F|nr:adenylate/guanylate cyclase domain-containing protein [Nordella sp. HKS 07]